MIIRCPHCATDYRPDTSPDRCVICGAELPRPRTGFCIVCGLEVRLRASGLAADHDYGFPTRRLCYGSARPVRDRSPSQEAVTATQEQREHGGAEKQAADLSKLGVRGKPIEQGARNRAEHRKDHGRLHDEDPLDGSLPEIPHARTTRPEGGKGGK